MLAGMTRNQNDQDQNSVRGRSAMVKVPELTAYFWGAKLLGTAMGESVSDTLGHVLGHAVAPLVAGSALVVALVVQFRARGYATWTYWAAVSMVAVFGTMAADILHGQLKMSYIESTLLYVVILAVIFLVWYRTEKTLSIHSIVGRRREAFYWATVMATFALGTAAGDLTASTFRLGYLASGVMFAVVMVIPLVSYWKFGMNPILSFWFAYVVTRPVGASFADWMAAPTGHGGLGLGTGLAAAILAAALLGLVTYMAVSGRDVKSNVHTPLEHTDAPGRGVLPDNRAQPKT